MIAPPALAPVEIIPSLAAKGQEETLALILRELRFGKRDGLFSGRERDVKWEESAAIARLETDRDPIGFATFHCPESKPVLWLHLLWVEPRFRRAGVASALLDGLKKHSYKVGRPIELGVLTGNGAMATLLAKRGADPVSTTYRLIK